MRNNYVSVLDFGSSKITVLSGNRNINNNFNIISSGQCDYAGFMNGDFIEPNLLKESVATAINNAQMNMKRKIYKLFVGIPAEFCVTSIQDVNVNFKSKTMLKQKVVSGIFEKNEFNNFSTTHTIINKSPIFYVLDNETKIFNPVGNYAQNVMVKTSYVYAENKIIQLLSSILHELGIKDYVFISSTLSESMLLLDEMTRQRGAILVDVGYITSSVCSVMGDGLIDLKSFSLGGAHITSDLSELLNLPFLQAEQLKRKLILTIKPTDMDYYDIILNDKIIKIPVKSANDIAMARIDMIIDTIEKIIKTFSLKTCDSNVIYLSGGGLSLIRGINNYICKTTSKKVVILEPKPMQIAKPELSSIIGLLDSAINFENFK